MRITQMLGKPIMAMDTGEKAGHVEEVLLDSTHHQAVAILVSNGLLSQQRVLPFREVQTVGADVVIARTISTMCGARAWVAERGLAHRSSALRGKPIVTSAGVRVGKVDDLEAEDRTGKITALTLGRGKRGVRSAVVHDLDTIDLTHDVVVVPRTAVMPTSDSDPKRPDSRGATAR